MGSGSNTIVALGALNAGGFAPSSSTPHLHLVSDRLKGFVNRLAGPSGSF
jgi:hypothetical protein